MHYLILIIGGLTGFIVYLIYGRKTTKVCPYCGERIKNEAILCRWCGTSLVTPTEQIQQQVEKFTQAVVEDNLKKMSAIVSLSVTKKILETQIFITQGIKLLNKNKNPKEKMMMFKAMSLKNKKHKK